MIWLTWCTVSETVKIISRGITTHECASVMCGSVVFQCPLSLAKHFLSVYWQEKRNYLPNLVTALAQFSYMVERQNDK